MTLDEILAEIEAEARGDTDVFGSDCQSCLRLLAALREAVSQAIPLCLDAPHRVALTDKIAAILRGEKP